MGFVTYGLGADISLLNAVPGGKVGSRKQRRANCVQKRSHGPKSRDDSFGTTLQRRCLEVLRFSLFSYVSAKLRNALADFIPTYEFTGFKRESKAAFCTAALLFNKYIFKYYVFMSGFMKSVLKTAGTKNSRHVFRKSVRYIYIYTWFFENRASKNNDSFYYLAVKNNNIRPKAD